MRNAKPNEIIRMPMRPNQRKGRVRKRIYRWGLVVILLGIGWMLYVLVQIGSIERNPAASSDLSDPAEVGIVLGAALWGDEPSPGLRERLDQSLKDYKAGKFQWFLLTGGLDTATSQYTKRKVWRTTWNSMEFRGRRCCLRTRQLVPMRILNLAKRS
ncbi:hypothetical protein U9M73_06680 [Paenibacillus phoenicis]|uniref:DUF218 domain-containing protein n=1 Tax=Paenibacillus phoenicis TaxID=554117 RepID=A0ABU5PIK5_9BACL|nr:hypothetical protein [Paenibacillus phoenicis]MEA3569682.1 hypothetical protein [Paenibacillus phoenicis]